MRCHYLTWMTVLFALCTASTAQRTLGHWVFAAEYLKQGKLDARKGSVNATVQGHARMLSAPFPTALVFAGRDDRVTIAHSLRLADLPKGAFTVSTWVAVDRPQTWGGIVSVMQDNGNFEKGWLLGFRDSKFCFGLSTKGADDGDGKLTYLTAKSDFVLGRWHHVAATYDQKTMCLYVDGKLAATSTGQSGPILYPRRATFEIGAYLDDDEHFPLHGLVHDVLLEDGTATAATIAQRYAADKAVFQTVVPDSHTPIAAWRFDSAHVGEGKISPHRGRTDITADGPIVLATGRTPEAIVLDGSTSLILDPSTASPTQALSVELSAWIADPTGRGTLISAHDVAGASALGWRIDYLDGHFRFGLTAGRADDQPTFITASATIRPFCWHHVTATYDGTQLRLYVDGKPDGHSRNELGLVHLPADVEVRIGAHRTRTGLRHGRALLHEVAIYASSLDATLVAEHSERLTTSVPAVLTFTVEPRLRFTDRNRARILWTSALPGAAAVEYFAADGRPVRVTSKRTESAHDCEIEGLPTDSDFAFRIIHTGDDGTERASATQTIDTTFNYTKPTIVTRPSPYPVDELTPRYRTAARNILDQSGIDRGYCVVLDGGTGRLAYELARGSNLQIIALEQNLKLVQKARKKLSAAGLYGPRVTVIHTDQDTLPFGDYFANLIVSDLAVRTGKSTAVTAEIERILRPNGGVLMLDTSELTRRPALTGAGDWTHQYGDAGNTASSGDMLVAGELCLQWFGKPGPRPMLDRGCRAPAPLVIGGRLFIQGDRKLFALDSYNGTILWTLEIPALRRVNMPRDCSNMTATADHIYAAIGDKCWQIDAQTGDLLKALPMPQAVTEDGLEWGYLGISGGKLLGTATPGKAIYKSANGEWYDKLDSDAAPVLGHELFAFDATDHTPAWRYRGGFIVHPTITVHNDTIFFVEERAPSKRTLAASRLRDMDGKNQFLVALDLQTGNKAWERQFDFASCKQVFYLSAAKNTLVVLGTSGQYYLYGFDASTGAPLWRHNHAWTRDHHGGGMQHPVIVGDSIYAEMKALDLRTGVQTRDDLPPRRGCGTMSASGRSLFYRHYHHGMWDLETDRRVQMPGIRSGCWLGMIPAGGLLLAPEASSGCSCAIPIQSSVAYRPVGTPR